MKLRHYSDKEIKKLLGERYYSNKQAMKPDGLWVSDESDFGWKAWCDGEQFRTDTLAYEHIVELSDDANVLIISNPKDLLAFSDTYKADHEINNLSVTREYVHYIDWQIVSEKYDGIIITPYLHSLRFNSRVMWYYGWDCASGCIWNLKAIKRFEYEKVTDSV